MSIGAGIMAGAAADTAAADVAIVKGQTPAADWALLTLADGTTRKARLQVVSDLPHLVVESAFGIDDGRWGILAMPGPLPGRHGPLWLVTESRAGAGASASDDADPDAPGQVVARAAVRAVVNRWSDGPDTPAGVRARLRAAASRETWLAARIQDLAAEVDDDTIRAARIAVQHLFRHWSALPIASTLRVTWPLPG